MELLSAGLSETQVALLLGRQGQGRPRKQPMPEMEGAQNSETKFPTVMLRLHGIKGGGRVEGRGGVLAGRR